MITNIPAGSNHNTLTIQGLCKYFFGLRALDGVSFTLSRGEILGLIGPNGSGKTTLINVVTGLLPATSGQGFVDGAEITNKKPHQVGHPAPPLPRAARAGDGGGGGGQRGPPAPGPPPTGGAGAGGDRHLALGGDARRGV